MAKRPPIDIKIPPGTGTTKKGSPYVQFVQYWSKKYPSLRTNAAAIYSAATAEHIDPVEFAALLLNESGANFNIGTNASGHTGIGQLDTGKNSAFIGIAEPWNKNHIVTAADLQNHGINIRLSAWYYGQMKGSHPDAAYGAYNAGPNALPAKQAAIQAAWTKQWITPWNPTYVSTAPTSPPSKAGQQVPGGTAPQPQDITFKNPYVVGIDKNGKFTTTLDPNKALQFDGAPLTRSNYLSLRDSLTSTYVSYTGQRPSNKQIETFLYGGQKGKPGVTPANAHAWSNYTLIQKLSHSPNFTKSPIYKERGIAIQDAVKLLLPTGAKVPPELMRSAIVNNWGADTVAAQLRTKPGYLDSEEFKGNVAALLVTHDSIMGSARPEDMLAVRDAALAGWTTAQYAAYLRSQPGYKNSTEYQQKGLGLMDALGLITGQQTVLTPGMGSVPGGTLEANPSGPLPADKRLPGQPTSQGALAGMGVSLSG